MQRSMRQVGAQGDAPVGCSSETKASLHPCCGAQTLTRAGPRGFPSPRLLELSQRTTGIYQAGLSPHPEAGQDKQEQGQRRAGAPEGTECRLPGPLGLLRAGVPKEGG